jgi:hypothetical protein
MHHLTSIYKRNFQVIKRKQFNGSGGFCSCNILQDLLHMKATCYFLYSALLREMWDFLPWICVYPCRKGIKIQQYVVQIISLAKNVTCYIVKANEVWVKTVMQTDDNSYTYYFVLQVYTCKALWDVLHWLLVETQPRVVFMQRLYCVSVTMFTHFARTV